MSDVPSDRPVSQPAPIRPIEGDDPILVVRLLRAVALRAEFGHLRPKELADILNALVFRGIPLMRHMTDDVYRCVLCGAENGHTEVCPVHAVCVARAARTNPVLARIDPEYDQERKARIAVTECIALAEVQALNHDEDHSKRDLVRDALKRMSKILLSFDLAVVVRGRVAR